MSITHNPYILMWLLVSILLCIYLHIFKNHKTDTQDKNLLSVISPLRISWRKTKVFLNKGQWKQALVFIAENCFKEQKGRGWGIKQSECG